MSAEQDWAWPLFFRGWEELGFALVKTEIEHELRGEVLQTMQEQAVAMGLVAEDARNKYTMRLDLT